VKVYQKSWTHSKKSQIKSKLVKTQTVRLCLKWLNLDRSLLILKTLTSYKSIQRLKIPS